MDSTSSATDLLSFSRKVGDGFKVLDKEYVALMRKVVPIDKLPKLSVEEATNFHMAVSWLYDYSLLLIEYKNRSCPAKLQYHGAPCLPGSSGPFIDNLLTRGDAEPDYTAVFSFGVEEAPAS